MRRLGILGCKELLPLIQSDNAGVLKIVSAVEVAFLIKMVVEKGMN